MLPSLESRTEGRIATPAKGAITMIYPVWILYPPFESGRYQRNNWPDMYPLDTAYWTDTFFVLHSDTFLREDPALMAKIAFSPVSRDAVTAPNGHRGRGNRPFSVWVYFLQHLRSVKFSS